MRIMKVVASIILSLGWIGVAFAHFDLIQVQSEVAEFIFKAVATALTPLALLASAGIFGISSIWQLPKFNIITWLLCLMGAAPLIYFYGPLIYEVVQNAL